MYFIFDKSLKLKKSFSQLLVISLIFILGTTNYSNAQSNWNDYLSFYRKFGSPLVGGNCQMTPSCSKYADIQFRKYGFTKGFIHTTDRLIRCSHDIEHYGSTKIDFNYKFIDFGDDSTNKANQEKWSKGIYAYNDTTISTNVFIKYLINQGHFSEALLETNRLIFSKSKDFYTGELFVNYFRILRKLNLQERIQLDYEIVVPDEFKSVPEILFEIGLSWLELSNYEKANQYFNKIVSNETLKKELVGQQTLVFQTYLESKQGDFEKATTFNESIIDFSTFSKNKKSNSTILNELKQFKPKKKSLAFVLGIIPGGGYLYSKHPKSAISALIINSLLSFATISTFKAQNVGLGILLGFTTLGFYAGNIKGGILSTERFNNTYTEYRIQKLYPNFSL